MKVLIVTRYMSVYQDAEQVIKELSSSLAKKGFESLVLSLTISEEVKELTKDIQVVTPKCRFPYIQRSSSLFSALGIIKEIFHLRGLVKKYYKDFDIINVHNFPANLVASFTKKPIIWMCNELPDFYYHPHPNFIINLIRSIGIIIDRRIVNKSVGIICTADKKNARSILDRYNRKSNIIPYGITPPADLIFDENEKMRIREQYGLKKEDFLILQVGAVCSTNNQKDSINAMNIIKRSIHNSKLIIAGEDNSPYANSLKEHLKENRMENRVIFTGFLPKKELSKLYSICDLCLFPAKLHGGSLAVFEAISFMIPTVVYPAVGASTLVRDHDLGIVNKDLITAITDAYDNYTFYKERAKRASNWIKNNLTWGKFVDNFIECYDNAYKNKKL